MLYSYPQKISPCSQCSPVCISLFMSCLCFWWGRGRPFLFLALSPLITHTCLKSKPVTPPSLHTCLSSAPPPQWINPMSSTAHCQIVVSPMPWLHFEANLVSHCASRNSLLSPRLLIVTQPPITSRASVVSPARHAVPSRLTPSHSPPLSTLALQVLDFTPHHYPLIQIPVYNKPVIECKLSRFT